MSSRNKRQKIEQINLEFIPLPEDIPPPPEPPPKLEQDDFRDHTQHQAASPRTTCIKTETSTSTTTRNRSQKRQHSLSPVPSPPPLPPIPADEIPVPSEIPSPPKPEPKLEPRSSIKIETEGEIAIMEENPVETDLMAKILGFSSFNSTKGKQVPGNQVGAVHVVKKRKYRQYMNRKGGFNRPLDKVP